MFAGATLSAHAPTSFTANKNRIIGGTHQAQISLALSLALSLAHKKWQPPIEASLNTYLVFFENPVSGFDQLLPLNLISPVDFYIIID